MTNPAPAAQPLARRPSGSEKRQRRGSSIRFLPDERAAIEQKARAAGLSFGSYARAVLLGTPGPRARRSPTVNAELLAYAVAALNKIGSNLNQIGRILNAARAAGTAEILAAASETRAAVALIVKIAGREDRP